MGKKKRCVKDLSDNELLSNVKVKLPYGFVTHQYLPRRNYYYIHSITGFTLWVKTRKNSSQVHPLMITGTAEVLNYELYEK
jgi:hypothetical protein